MFDWGGETEDDRVKEDGEVGDIIGEVGNIIGEVGDIIGEVVRGREILEKTDRCSWLVSGEGGLKMEFGEGEIMLQYVILEPHCKPAPATLTYQAGPPAEGEWGPIRSYQKEGQL